jgi:hypothetical protein
MNPVWIYKKKFRKPFASKFNVNKEGMQESEVDDEG